MIGAVEKSLEKGKGPNGVVAPGDSAIAMRGCTAAAAGDVPSELAAGLEIPALTAFG